MITYGSKTNSELIKFFGFLDLKNANEVVTVSLPIPASRCRGVYDESTSACNYDIGPVAVSHALLQAFREIVTEDHTLKPITDYNYVAHYSSLSRYAISESRDRFVLALLRYRSAVSNLVSN
jgi:hypothetical protein